MAQQVRRGDVSTISAVIVPSRSSPLHTYDMDQRHSYKGVQGSCRRMIMPLGAQLRWRAGRSLPKRRPMYLAEIKFSATVAAWRLGAGVAWAASWGVV